MSQLASAAPIAIERPALIEQLAQVFSVLSQAGAQHPVAFGLGVSELDNGQQLRYLDVIALQPDYGIGQIREALSARGLRPEFRAGADIVSDFLLSFPEFDVSLRLREGVVYEQQGHKKLTPLTAADLVYASNTPGHQIAADGSGAVYASSAYIKLREARPQLCRIA